jgi:Druantia protein DruA
VTFVLQGRELGPIDLGLIRQLISDHPQWSRRRLSQVLCEQWNWRNAAGQLKDMASRTLLLKLERRGEIALPARRQTPVNRMRQTRVATYEGEISPYTRTLAQAGPLLLSEVSRERSPRWELAGAMARFHYLGFGGTVGENLQYTVRDAQGRLLAGLVFGSAAWKCQDRDRFIGWRAEQRKRNLFLLTNNTRFIILPWIKVPLLASWTLAAVLRRLSRDWRLKYGHPIHLVETFVERDRFAGTAYQAANWTRVGATTGRTRQDRYSTIQAPIKDVYLYPLGARFKERLCV